MSRSPFSLDLIDERIPISRRLLTDDERDWLGRRAKRSFRAHLFLGFPAVVVMLLVFVAALSASADGPKWVALGAAAVLFFVLYRFGRAGWDWTMLRSAKDTWLVNVYCAPEDPLVGEVITAEVQADSGLLLTVDGKRVERVTWLDTEPEWESIPRLPSGRGLA